MKSFLFLSLMLLLWMGRATAVGDEKENDKPGSVRIVTEEELSTKNGVGTSDIWLSILGEVYDVSSGKEFYGEGTSYHVFAGRDGSIPFITGVFTAEEAKKGTDVLSPAQLNALEQWRNFYSDSDKYPFVGKLQGRYYDSHGDPTDELKDIRERIANFKAEKEKAKAEKEQAKEL